MAKFACWLSFMVLLSIAFVAYSQDECLHIVNLKTGTKQNAGTDAKVSLNLYDKQGKSALVKSLAAKGVYLSGHNYFENGKTDYFAFTTPCLRSPVCKVKLSHDNSGSKPGWFVDNLKIKSYGPRMTSSTRTFNFDQWLAIDEPPFSFSATRNHC